MSTRVLVLGSLLGCATPRPVAPLFSTCENGVCDPGESVASCPIDCQPSAPVPRPPELALSEAGRFHHYVFAASATGWDAADTAASAHLGRDGDTWQLTLRAATKIDQVMFPWETPGAKRESHDRVYYTYLGGVVEAEGSREPYAWWGLPYPGETFAPLLIVGDEHRARLIAAANWPPRPVVPMHAARQSMLSWPQEIDAGAERTLRVILADFVAEPGSGYAPWQLATVRYQRWLASVMPPEHAPGWIEDNEGFINVQLQNFGRFDLAAIETIWADWSRTFDWIVFWGQASTYAGPAELAVPSPDLREEVGCCLPRHELHARYDGLLAFVSRVRAAHGHVAFYARPMTEPSILTEAGAAALRDWLARNAGYGADAAYVDTLGRTTTTSPATMLALFADGTIPAASLIEGFVDIYPRPSLISGYVAGGAAWRSALDATTCERCTFVRLGRLLLGARAMYFGSSNGELIAWGAEGNHVSERTAFLLGAKLEIIKVVESDGSANPYVADIVKTRRGAHWWARHPRYLDTMGVTEVPAGITVRRFHADDGAELLAVDNPRHARGQICFVKHRRVELSSDAVSIAEVR